jgi:hypothetical protein
MCSRSAASSTRTISPAVLFCRAHVVLARLEVPLACVVRALEWAREVGARTIIDPDAPTRYVGLLNFGRLERLLRRLRQSSLLLVVIVDGRAILCPDIAELPIWRNGIDVLPEHVEELRVGDFRRILDDFHGLRVAGDP